MAGSSFWVTRACFRLTAYYLFSAFDLTHSLMR
uniref:Uncharacterized protein n=1 Tax=Anguilla anguilla TaxID=7936 RepID=A0A0E9TQ89_ANGAN